MEMALPYLKKQGLLIDIGVWMLFVTAQVSFSNIIDRHGVDGSIESPGFPKNYPNNANVTWRMFGPLDAISLSVTILQFDLFNDTECHDFLQITQVNNNSVVFRGCGTQPETNYVVLGNKVLITFISDGKNTAKGFKMRWKVRDYKKENEDPIVIVYRCPDVSSSDQPLSTKLKHEVASDSSYDTHCCQTSPNCFRHMEEFLFSLLALVLVIVLATFLFKRQKSLQCGIISKPQKTNSTPVQEAHMHYSTIEE